MRSVFAFLRDTTDAEVASYLDRAYPNQREPWVLFSDGDPILYIDLYRHAASEFEPDEWADLVQQLGGEPAVGVIAHITGRRPGDEQVLGFETDLLEQFRGAAMDEYTSHLWSLAELRAHGFVSGHTFFDYNGWYVERRPDA